MARILAVMAAVVIACGTLPAQAPPPPPAAKPGTPATQAPPAQKAPPGPQTLPVPSPRDSVKPDDVVLTIGPEKITREQFEAIKRGLPPQYAGVVNQMGEKPFASNYANFRGLALLAEREKLDQSPDFREQLSFARMELLARLAIQYVQNQSQVISDDEIKKHYEANKEQFQQAKVKGIFVALNPPARPAAAGTAPEQPKPRTDAEARARAEDLRKQVLAGADFAAVAKANSDHRDSAEKGGDFGTIRRNQLPASLEKAVFSLNPKEVSEPVKEGQGYYIFQVEDPRAVTLDEAAAAIRNTLQQQKMESSMKGVQAQFPVVFNDQYFAEAQAAPRPVITGVAPGQPTATPPPAAKKP